MEEQCPIRGRLERSISPSPVNSTSAHVTPQMSDRSKTRFYYAACVCLIIAAAALRFYALPVDGLVYDEASVALSSQGSLEEVFENTRDHNASPILYPLVLYVVQKVEISPLSLRIVPATASVLTVAALLLLLPRVGVSRWAAFIAALLATSSLNVIFLARYAREYSVDTFVAVLMIAGLLAYIRDKHGGGIYVLFCVSLFVAPLVQYGLVLFGIAIFGTIAVMEVKALWGGRSTLRDGLRFPAGWVWRRMAYMAWPAACFAAGSVTSYVVTLRYQWVSGGLAGGGYLSQSYYSGGYTDISAMTEFLLPRTELLFSHYMPELLAILGLAGFGVFVIVSVMRRRLDAVAILLLFSIAIASCAALLRMYPYGGIRQCLYLVPIIFLAFGYALHSIAVDTSSLTRRGWPAHVGMAVAAVVIAFIGGGAIRDGSLYEDSQNVDGVLDALMEGVQEGDSVYFALTLPQVVHFYIQQKPSNYYDGKGCVYPWALQRCVKNIVKLAYTQGDRLWVVGYEHRTPKLEMLEELHEEFHGMDAVRIVVEGFDNSAKLYVLEAPHLFDRLRKPVGTLNREGELAVSSKFDVYIREDDLSYVKEPCSLEDVAEQFFLHVAPTNVDDLPDARKQYEFENLDFAFLSYGIVTDGKCVAVRDLPEYDIESISTGQFDEEVVSWQGRFHLGESDALLAAYRYAANSAPAAQSVFDVYVRAGRVIYVKEPCDVGDVAARFFVHVTPADVEGLPEDRKEYGFDNLDFEFSSFGIVDEGRCIAARDLPEYDIESISTGQFAEEGEIWRSEFPFTDD